jgi:SEFIR domain
MSAVPDVDDLTKPRRVFISYANASSEHRQLVRQLWEFLRSCRIDAKLDQAAEGRQDWALWKAGEIREADHILVIASEMYRRCAEGRAGVDDGPGVQWEARLIRDTFHRDQYALDRFLPVILPGQTVDGVPDFLAPATTTVYHVSEFSAPGAESLVRLLTDQPANPEPPLGQLPVLRGHESMPGSQTPPGPRLSRIAKAIVVALVLAAGSVATLMALPGGAAPVGVSEPPDTGTITSDTHVLPTGQGESSAAPATTPVTTFSEPAPETTVTFDPDTPCVAVNGGSVDVPIEFFPVPSMESSLVSECESHPAETVRKAVSTLQEDKIDDRSSCAKANDSIAIGSEYVVDEYLAGKVAAGVDSQGYWVAFETECFDNPNEAVGRAFSDIRSAG